jgi:hypothetical protein
MSTHRILNALLAVFVVAAWLYLAANFDRAALEGDARHQADLSAEQRFARAAAAMCGGENATWELLADGTVQCRTKRGAKTITAQVTP